MSELLCEDQGKKEVTLIQGVDRKLLVSIIDKNDKKAFNLTDNSEVEVIFEKDDGSTLSKKKTLSQVLVLSAPRGEIQVNLSKTDTALLKVGDGQSFEIVITFTSGDVDIAQVKEKLNVVARLFQP